MIGSEVMCDEVIKVDPEMTLPELAQLFTDRKISGAPVVDAGGRLLGVVSQTDLVRSRRELDYSGEPPSFYGEAGMIPSGFHVESIETTRARDVMTPVVHSADESTPVERLAALMLEKKVHRLILTRRGRLSGIVSSMDLLKALAARAAA